MYLKENKRRNKNLYIKNTKNPKRESSTWNQSSHWERSLSPLLDLKVIKFNTIYIHFKTCIAMHSYYKQWVSELEL